MKANSPILFMILLQSCIHIGTTLRIAVVGSGPAGLLLASRILDKPIERPITCIDIYEARDDPRLTTGHKSFAIGYNTRCIQACDAVPGLTKFIQDEACSLITHTINVNGWKKKMAINPGFKGRYMTTQPLFTCAMLNWIDQRIQASTIPLKFHFKSKCMGVDPLKGHLLVDKNASITTYEYDLIIGADGARSAVKNAIISQPDVAYEGHDLKGRWKFIPIEVDHMINQFQNRSGFFNIDGIRGGWWWMPTGRVHSVMFWKPTSDSDMHSPKTLQTDADCHKFIQRALNCTDDKVLQETATTILNTKGAGVNVFCMDKYHHNTGRVVLIGDAAHTMSSALGQGMACALADANSLYHHLSTLTENTVDLLPALEAYSKERVPEGNAITKLNYLLSNNPSKSYMLMEMIRKMILRKRTLFEEINSVETPYTTLYNRYKRLILRKIPKNVIGL